MTAPAREELRPLVDLVHRLQFKRETEGGDRIYGMKLINDLRPRPWPETREGNARVAANKASAILFNRFAPIFN
ncbi:hypothetical protein ACFOKF_00175 [Sphingobium rhizovicinum]|uniref:Uncharacterized protein n=1 Tax=Sphingobium rhizovicinum TaxID=432308 RepID=A0ABV7NA67_9SPHN